MCPQTNIPIIIFPQKIRIQLQRGLIFKVAIPIKEVVQLYSQSHLLLLINRSYNLCCRTQNILLHLIETKIILTLEKQQISSGLKLKREVLIG
ncbi:hypothetical protein EVA_20907 [gut metagenome]|uniref:Uncharacterized protein n=1 Tax=gut metagenome TaxID=749906 RepID=J9BTT8_9ZZZZ